MRDALTVRGVERIADLRGAFQSLIQREGSFKRLTFDVLHHQVIWSDVVKLADVRVIQRRHGASLAVESFTELALSNLKRDDAIQPRVAGFVHLSHAARSDR